MGETIEKRLKDYKGFEVWKVTDNKGTSKEEVTYMLNDSDGNNINCFQALKDLKQFADNYLWKWHFKGGRRMKIYKVYYRTGNGNESYTFIEADSKEMIESVLYHVQGMTTELIRFEEV